MITGAASADIALLIVDVDEGVKSRLKSMHTFLNYWYQESDYNF